MLGLIGGISWVSTIEYYKLINQGINQRLGGLNFAQCLIYSFNYADIKKNNDAGDWENNYQMVVKAGRHLKNSGANGIVLCANTMHYIADRAEKAIGLPLIHIATATASVVKKAGLKKVGLLGTKFTMELDFFKAKLWEQQITVIIPDESERNFIHQTIFDELGKGDIREQTRDIYLHIISRLIEEGAQGIILGCTEVGLVVRQDDVPVPVFDTTLIHSAAAVEFALSAENL